jgi:hypothetical protein
MKERALAIGYFLWDRKLRTAFLVALLVGAIVSFGPNGFTSPRAAQADACHTEKGTWNLKSAGITVARVTFGATICEENGNITGVSPLFEGSTDGVGSMTGWVFDSGGSWVESSSAHAAVIKAESSAKLCTPLKSVLPCSLTDRQTYRLVYYNTYGPYLTQPGFRLVSNTHFLGGGDAPQITFQKIG